MAFQPPPKVPTQHELLCELAKVRGENRDLKEFNRNLEARREHLTENSRFLGEKCEGLAKEVCILRGALQDIANENTGIEPALFAYALLNPE